MNGANALVGISVSVSERYCGWFSIRDRIHNVDSLNWIMYIVSIQHYDTLN